MLALQARTLTGQYGGPEEVADVIDVFFEASDDKSLSKIHRRRVVLCLDCSGSMQGEPISMVKRTVKAIIQMIKEVEYPIDLTIITFSDEAKIINLDDIDKITATGYTNISDSLELAYNTFGEDILWLALLTDGLPNRGKFTTASNLKKLVKSMPNVFVQGFGYGDYNISILKGISETYQHITDIEDIPMIFGSYLGEIMATVGSNVKIYLPAPPERNKPYGTTTRSHPESSCRITAGNLHYSILVAGITYRVLILPSGDYQCPEYIQKWEGLEIIIHYTNLEGQQISVKKVIELSLSLPNSDIQRAYFRSARGRIIERLSSFPNRERIKSIRQKIALWPELAHEEINEINRTIDMIEKGSFDQYIASGSAAETQRYTSYTNREYMSDSQTRVMRTLGGYVQI